NLSAQNDRLPTKNFFWKTFYHSFRKSGQYPLFSLLRSYFTTLYIGFRMWQ
ncbi:hypothetical protein DOA62_25280, partial [Salmonella enterica subsp. enterica]|nr:hypothetical protein [Salmonella enterica subsp. enterica serovar Montevideo]